MSQGNEQDEECFVPAYWEQIAYQTNLKDVELPELNINKLLEQAKQLHNRSKPKTIVSRTCFLQLPLTKLPDQLQQPCIQQQIQQFESSPFTPIQNIQHLSIQQYFSSHELIYNKMKMYNRPGFQLSQTTSRFKPISHLSDFHQKLFKQLSDNDIVKTTARVAINDQFDSNFQCGNLGIVYKQEDTMDRQYFLLLENDVNSHGYTSWFFFKVKSCGKGLANFHIVNLSKSSYLYRIGFKISIFSIQKFKQKGTRWFKGGKNIQTYTTNFDKKAGGQKYNCLYFQYQFQQNQSEVYFAMSRPYTYTNLSKDIKQLQMKVQNKQLKLQVINSIYSISCNIIPVLVFSNKNQQTKVQSFEIQNAIIEKDKKTIIFMARQHPGEVIGSNFMKKIMQIFAGQMQQVKQLLNKFTIIMIPMVNPDGVIHGSSRCNLAGLDLNRQWMKQCVKEVTPQTYYLRKLIWNIQQNVGIQYLIDFHGHSKKMNSFFFSNKLGDRYPSEYLPYTICKLNKKFDIFSCTFNTTIDKKNTLRNQLYQNGMKNCITVQNSYFGYFEQKAAKLFQQADFQQMSESIIKSLYFLFSQDQEIVSNFAKNIGFSKEQLYNEIKNCKQMIVKKSNRSTQNNDIQSDSDPQGDIMKPQQMMKIYQYQSILPQKKLSLLKKKKKNSRLKEMKSTAQKGDQLRVSEPMRMNKDFQAIQSKIHKSQKKLEPNSTPSTSIKASTQQRFTEQPRAVIPAIKRFSSKKETVIRQTVLSMNEQQSQNLKQLKEDKTKGRAFGAPFYKLQNLETYTNKPNNKRRIQSRLRTEVESDKIKTINKVPGSYGKIKQQSIQIFLNETLSIAKVNKNGVEPPNRNLGFQDMCRRKNSLKSQKYLDRSHRFQASNDYSRTGLQVDTSPKRESIAEQRLQRKKHLSFNYKKQLTRRKKILTSQVTNSKYRKFQKFTENNVNQIRKQDVKLQCSSVFYYFPVL